MSPPTFYNTDDIAWSSFLAGDKRQYFENLEGYVSLRMISGAIVVC